VAAVVASTVVFCSPIYTMNRVVTVPDGHWFDTNTFITDHLQSLYFWIFGVVLKVRAAYTPPGRKRNHFSFVNKSNLRKLTEQSTLVVNEYYRRCYLFNFWNLHQFAHLSMQKV